MKWKFWVNEETQEQRDIRSLEARVKKLEAETAVSRRFLYQYADGEAQYTDERPKVGEAVRLLMEHLGLAFKAGTKTKTPDALVKKETVTISGSDGWIGGDNTVWISSSPAAPKKNKAKKK